MKAMTHYIVINQFKDTFGAIVEVGEAYEAAGDNPITLLLISNGFIKEIENADRWWPKIDDTVYYLDVEYGISLPLVVKSAKFTAEDWDVGTFQDDETVFQSRRAAEMTAEAMSRFFRYIHDDPRGRPVELNDLIASISDARTATCAGRKRGKKDAKA